MRYLDMTCHVTIPMADHETREHAEDRLLELLDDNGIVLGSWWDEDEHEGMIKEDDGAVN